MRVRVLAIDVAPLSVPLREPFVIATGRIDITRAALVRATLADDAAGAARARSRRGRGAAAGHARGSARICWRDRRGAAPQLRKHRIAGTALASPIVARALPGSARRARRRGVGGPRRLGARRRRAAGAALGGPRPPMPDVTDITLPISDPERMAAAARAIVRAGFACFKVKVGRDWRADLASLRAVDAAVPDARFASMPTPASARADALALLDAALATG